MLLQVLLGGISSQTTREIQANGYDITSHPETSNPRVSLISACASCTQRIWHPYLLIVSCSDYCFLQIFYQSALYNVARLDPRVAPRGDPLQPAAGGGSCTDAAYDSGSGRDLYCWSKLHHRLGTGLLWELDERHHR